MVAIGQLVTVTLQTTTLSGRQVNTGQLGISGYQLLPILRR